MERTPVTSSNLVSIGYEPTSEILEIEFKAGTVYQYASVPKEVYDELMSSDSHGSYFHRNIRNNYSFTKLD